MAMIILLFEFGAVAFFLCRYLDTLTKELKKEPKETPKPKKTKPIEAPDIARQELMQYLENIDNFNTNAPQKEFN